MSVSMIHSFNICFNVSQLEYQNLPYLQYQNQPDPDGQAATVAMFQNLFL